MDCDEARKESHAMQPTFGRARVTHACVLLLQEVDAGANGKSDDCCAPDDGTHDPRRALQSSWAEEQRLRTRRARSALRRADAPIRLRGRASANRCCMTALVAGTTARRSQPLGKRLEGNDSVETGRSVQRTLPSGWSIQSRSRAWTLSRLDRGVCLRPRAPSIDPRRAPFQARTKCERDRAIAGFIGRESPPRILPARAP
jgi:hypothetical protein